MDGVRGLKLKPHMAIRSGLVLDFLYFTSFYTLFMYFYIFYGIQNKMI